MLDITRLMDGLAAERPVFHSEADFQHALAWRIREETGSDVRLEFPPFPAERIYLDLWVPSIRVAIELKYLTSKLNVTLEGETFAIREQGAQDIRRYDFLKDLVRLEKVLAKVRRAQRGIAVLLTNDPLYWKPPFKPNTVDAAFRLQEGRELPARMAWSKEASPGTTKGRESALLLAGSYKLGWRNYGIRKEASNSGQFRYLAVQVPR